MKNQIKDYLETNTFGVQVLEEFLFTLENQIKDYLETNSFGIEVLKEEGKTVHFEFWNDKKETKKFRTLLKTLNLEYKESKENDGGNKVDMFKVNKEQINQLLG